MSAIDDFNQWCAEADDPQLTLVSYEALMRLFAEVDLLRAFYTPTGPRLGDPLAPEARNEPKGTEIAPNSNNGVYDSEGYAWTKRAGFMIRYRGVDE